MMSRPLFFIGSSPSLASRILSDSHPVDGVMVSVNALKNRKSDFTVKKWILDSGAFSEITKFGGYRSEVSSYLEEIKRWNSCGEMLTAVSQDYMCETIALQRTGLGIAKHQSLTIQRYDELIALCPPVPIMAVLQGYSCSDYLQHLISYGHRLSPGQWVGVGSVCRRKKLSEIEDILRGIKLIRPDLRLHGFGLKLLALENSNIKEMLYSCDSMAWSYSRRFSSEKESEKHMADSYQQKINTAVNDFVQNRLPPRTAGANNGQGRKPKFKSKTRAIRVPEKYIPKIIEFVKNWEREEIE